VSAHQFEIGEFDMHRREVWMLALRGVLAIVFGIIAVIWPGVTALALAIVFGVYAIIDGAGMLVAAFRRPGDTGQRTIRGIAGVLGIALGIAALVWPGITATILAIVIGVWALVTGAIQVWAATQVRGQWMLGIAGALSAIAGLLILIRPSAGAVAIAWVIGIYAIVAGVLMLAATWQLSHSPSGRGTGRPAAAGI
jgi:uncharacterized membrane protein HdeD (DUF308 family)